jgi:hypothetical protein
MIEVSASTGVPIQSLEGLSLDDLVTYVEVLNKAAK